jgi:hypothetical protein
MARPGGLAVKAFNVGCFMTVAHLIGRLILEKDARWRSTTLFALIAFLPIGSYVAYVMPSPLR